MVSAAAFAVLASALFCSVVFSAPVGLDTPSFCCFSHTARPIPRKTVVGYYETSSKCSLAAVVFITKKGRAVCADPSKSWVQLHVTTLARM
ncbi:C-C motif chemokine 3-like [Carettochelys insculpta]|uniref:C-C motif chemokine 3-like n=1 Tax=Carettochelys insculpta TaxID=44489 RepID=UPI003EC0D82C